MEIRDKIINSAMDLFLKYGLKNVTMDEVAASIGISKRTIYENFSNKKELLAASVDRMIQTHIEYEEEMKSKTSNIIEEIFITMMNMDEHFQSRIKVGMDMKKYYPDIFEAKIGTQYERAYEKMKVALERGVEQGIISPDTNFDFAVFLIMETIYNILSRPEILIIKKISVIEAFRYIIIYFFRGISTDKGIAIMDEKIAEMKNRK
ncbi:MAG: TetR/AcrR family transcriptional regulator [Rikenellaceae bacterium]|nr:TetR/AcrR family transcriptional regulator [Rikenellaceae bacterium]